MTVKFNVVARGKPGDKVTPKKFYPSVVATGKVDQLQVAKMAADVSTVTEAAVIENFRSIVTNEIARGKRAVGRLRIVLAQNRVGGRSPGRRRAQGQHYERPAAFLAGEALPAGAGRH